MHSILNWVAAHGYAAIFGVLVLGIVGLPLPDETLLVFSGFLIYSGRLHAGAVLFWAWLGSSTGITISYLLGRRFGLPLIHSKIGRYTHISDAQIQRVHNWFHRLGHWALLAGYFIPGVRHFTALVAGTSLLEYRYFALYAYCGAACWVCTFVFLGYHFGEQWEAAVALVDSHLWLALGIACAAAACYLLVRYALRKRTAKPGAGRP